MTETEEATLIETRVTPWHAAVDLYHLPPCKREPIPIKLPATMAPGKSGELLGRTAGDIKYSWAKIRITDKQGVKGIYYTPLMTTGYAIGKGSQTPYAVQLDAPELMTGGEHPDIALFVVIFKGKIYDAPYGNANTKDYAHQGTILHVTKIVDVGGPKDGFIQVKWPDAQMKEVLWYFDNKAPCPLAILYSEYNDCFVPYSGYKTYEFEDHLPIFDPDNDTIEEPGEPGDPGVPSGTLAALEARVAKIENSLAKVKTDL